MLLLTCKDRQALVFVTPMINEIPIDMDNIKLWLWMGPCAPLSFKSVDYQCHIWWILELVKLVPGETVYPLHDASCIATCSRRGKPIWFRIRTNTGSVVSPLVSTSCVPPVCRPSLLSSFLVSSVWLPAAACCSRSSLSASLTHSLRACWELEGEPVEGE